MAAILTFLQCINKVSSNGDSENPQQCLATDNDAEREQIKEFAV